MLHWVASWDEHAIFVVNYMFNLHHDCPQHITGSLVCFQVLGGSVKDLYKLLKLVRSMDQDSGVQLHVDMALQEIDTFMRETLFPKQELTKKIRVLDPE